MYVCLCNAVTNGAIQAVIDGGARTTKEVAERCGAGAVCGRCRSTVRAMLVPDANSQEEHGSIRRRIRRG